MRNGIRLVLALAGLVALAACRSRADTLTVKVLNWPEPADTSACDFMTEHAEAPESPTWPTVEEDFYRRQYVHRLDYEKAVTFMHDVAMEIDAMRRCIEALQVARGYRP